MTNIKFGTDGWRAVCDKDFNIENVNKVINGISYYVYGQSKYDKKIIIGYDPRNKADEYAFYIADKIAKNGFKTELSDKITATPVVAYRALNQDAYAIMITASHNPPEYLGIKFIPPYGGPAEDNMVKEITDNLEKEFVPFQSNVLNKVSFEKEYLQHIEKIIDFERIKRSKIKINYDGHHGAAAKLFKQILDLKGIENNSQNLERDINFGGTMPDPKEQYLQDLKKLCELTNLIGLSNDGDGDRFGVFDEKGNYISANDIIAMLLIHLTKNKKMSGKLAKTVGASSMLDIVAEKNGVKVIETPVGFKHLGKVMRNDDIVIAGEESGGLSIKGHIPEKDGILANLLIIEMMAYEDKSLYELHNNFLSDLNRKFFNDRIDLKLNSKDDQDKIIEKINNIKSIGEYKVVKKNTLDGLKIYLDDDSRILIRKSGTEPLLRIYFESDKEEKINYFKNAVKQLC